MTLPGDDTPVKQRRILVADDERRVVQFMTACLTEAGHLVTGTTDWTDVVARAKSFHPDLIVLDLHQPRLGSDPLDSIRQEPAGCEVVKALHADASLATVPVILLIAVPSSDDRMMPCQNLPASAVSYLYKPFSREQLLARVADPCPGEPAHLDYRRHLAQLRQDTGQPPIPSPPPKRPWWRWPR